MDASRPQDDTARIDEIRAFNRFYTDRIGLLDRAYLDDGYTLAEARLLYEIGARGTTTATALRADLHLDPAYLSRMLKSFRARDFVATTTDDTDRRSQVLRLTDAGRAEFERLSDLSRRQIGHLIEGLGEDQRTELNLAMRRISDLLEGPERHAEPVLLRPHRPGDLTWMVGAQTGFYCGELGWDGCFEAIASRIAADFLDNFNPAREHCWIAERAGRPLGCVMVVDGGAGTAKLRMLFVHAEARGLGLGLRLASEAVNFARKAGYREITLWTTDVLEGARRIYRKLGFHLVAQVPQTIFGPQLVDETWTLDLKTADEPSS